VSISTDTLNPFGSLLLRCLDAIGSIFAPMVWPRAADHWCGGGEVDDASHFVFRPPLVAQPDFRLPSSKLAKERLKEMSL
jgi:hypothetical protein